MWKRSGKKAAQSLALVASDLSGGTSPPPSFNSYLVVVEPKNPTAAELRTGASRPPQDTRPLKLKDCSIKAVAGAVNFKLAGIVAAWQYSERSCTWPAIGDECPHHRLCSQEHTQILPTCHAWFCFTSRQLFLSILELVVFPPWQGKFA